jgi:exodeoxyribonuclease V beta subunit
VMTTPLDPQVPGLTLSRVAPAQRLCELEFYFPLQKLSPSKLHQVLRAYWTRPPAGDGAEPEPFSFAPVEGMLKGFIDLVFEFQGRYYVVDWKSNRLGGDLEAYNTNAMAAEIRRQHYYFQYQLYTVALDRYLRLRLPGYDYEQHFGGVYYIFLRGLDPGRADCGVHRDRLPAPFVRRLNECLSGGAGGREA